MEIQTIFYHATRLTIVVTFILSVLFIRNKWKGRYLSFFPYYHGTSILTEAITEAYFSSPKLEFELSSSIAYNIFTVIEFLFFSFFIYSVVQTGRRVILWTVISFLLIMSLFIRWFNFLQPPYLSLLVQNFFLLFSCLVYFNDVFSSFAVPNLSKQPAFWIVTGILYYSVITTPSQVYQLFNNVSLKIGSVLHITTNGTAYILMYSLFVKAYTCKQTPQAYALKI